MSKPTVEELLLKIQHLEATHNLLEHQCCMLRNSARANNNHSRSNGDDGTGSTVATLGEELDYLNILQCLGHSVHIFDVSHRIIFWSKSAEKLYGFTAEEALGQDVSELMVDPYDHQMARTIVDRVLTGERWTGLFPVRNKKGQIFTIVATNTPLYDDEGIIVAEISVTYDSQRFEEVKVPMTGSWNSGEESNVIQPRISIIDELDDDSEKPLQSRIKSKISSLASKVSDKVKSKLRSTSNTDHEGGSKDTRQSNHSYLHATISGQRVETYTRIVSTHKDVKLLLFNIFSRDEDASSIKITRRSEARSMMRKIITLEDDLWSMKSHFSWQSLKHDRGSENVCQRSPNFCLKFEKGVSVNSRTQNEDSGSLFSSISCSNSYTANSDSGNSSWPLREVDIDSDCFAILWKDLTILEQLGQGSHGTVYRALWHGSDVAVNVFEQEYSYNTINSFRKEVSIMKRLRHPNVILFMGALTSAQCLCIVTEFLPRGSLFGLLHKMKIKLDWRRRVYMALDIARGMNYLHHFNPPIIHRNLKSSNLLVDKDWTVKVADFGLSHIRHESYLSAKNSKGMITPQWMAPEVLRCEPLDEKSDVYSYGVILWELASEKIPWDDLNSVEVIKAVGFMDQRLEIPVNIDRRWASIIDRCLQSDPRYRPTFLELLEELGEMQRHCCLQFHAARSATAVDCVGRGS